MGIYAVPSPACRSARLTARRCGGPKGLWTESRGVGEEGIESIREESGKNRNSGTILWGFSLLWRSRSEIAEIYRSMRRDWSRGEEELGQRVYASTCKALLPLER